MRYSAISRIVMTTFSISTLFVVSSGVVNAEEVNVVKPGHLAQSAGPNPSVKDVEKINITGNRNRPNSEPTEQTQQLLAIAGIDSDPLAAAFSLPGVVYGGGDFGGEPAIRGSSPDDNSFFVDNVPVDYIFHLFGDSIFNKNIVRTFDLHSAAYGSTYSDATGGVFDVKLRDPRKQPIKTTFDASFLKVGVFTEGSLADNQAFYFSYRHSLLQFFFPEGEEEDGVKVFEAPISDDYQGKYQWLVGDDHKVTFAIGGASDKLGLSISEQSEEGRSDPDIVGDAFAKTSFDNQSLTWDYFPNRTDQYSLLVSHLAEQQNEYFGDEQFVKVDEDAWVLRAFAQTNRFPSHSLKAGVDVENRAIDYAIDLIPYFCTEQTNNCVDQKGERINDKDRLDVKVTALYLEDIWTINSDWQLTSGLRAEKENYSDSSFVHPRIRLDWMPTNKLAFHMRAGKYSQLQSAEYTVRILGNPDLDPIESSQVALGSDWSIVDLWSLSGEVYYKEIEKLPRSLDIENDPLNLRYTNEVSGETKGIELLLEKARGNENWHSWLSLSWSTSDRTDDVTNVTTPYRLDTPVVVNWVYNMDISEKWSFGLRYTFRSGARYSPIVGIKPNPDYPENFVPVYGELNSEQLPNYSRLDIQADYATTFFGKEASWTFALINALGQQNTFGYYYEPKEGDTLSNYKITPEEGIGAFPSIGFSVSF